MTNPPNQKVLELPSEAFNTTLPETFADCFFFVGNPSLVRLAFGCERPDGSARYDTAVRIPAHILVPMIEVLIQIRDQLGIQPPPAGTAEPQPRH